MGPKDQNGTTSSKPMRLLALGLSRTGTSSLCLALDRLGYKTFHMSECLTQPDRYFPPWIAAVKAKFGGQGKPFTKADFDAVLHDYDALSDAPANLFSPELLAAYPDAKVILTTRDPEKWLKSIQSTIWRAGSWWTWDYLAPFHSLIRGWRTCDILCWDAFINSTPDKPSLYPMRTDRLSDAHGELAIRRFHEHNDYVRSIVPKENLLEFQPQDGWEPLCKFLGHEVPKDEPYPRVWDAGELVKLASTLWWVGVGTAVVKLVGPVAVVTACAWGAKRVNWW